MVPAAVEASLRAMPKIRPEVKPALRTAVGAAKRTWTFAGAGVPIVAAATHTGEDPTRAAAAVAGLPAAPRAADTVPAAGSATAAAWCPAVALCLAAAGVDGAYQPGTGEEAGSGVCGGDHTWCLA